MERPAETVGPVHPGEILREEFLKPLGMWDLLNGGRVTDVLATRLSNMFGGTAEFWLNLQRQFDQAGP
jgi:plasmid maintenance system antidote protein VapI